MREHKTDILGLTFETAPKLPLSAADEALLRATKGCDSLAFSGHPPLPGANTDVLLGELPGGALC